MRAIDADALVYESIDSSDTLRHESYYGTGILAIRKEDIDDAPTIKPEQVHCKDCLMHGVCRFEQGLGLDGYCSKAERREDG